VPEPSDRRLRSVLIRIGLWLVCLLLSVPLFSLVLALSLASSESAAMSAIFPIIRVTMIFALPVWCLYLPVVIALKDAEQRRIWTILLSGSLIGPLAMLLWSLILQLRGFSQKAIWQGDPLLGWLGGGIAAITFSFIVGLLTTSLYVIALRLMHRRSIASESRYV
jgi:hypothetical protein